MKENPLMKTILFYFCHPIAKVAQLVEHDLAKVGVASSNLVFRSKRISPVLKIIQGYFFYDVNYFIFI